MGLLDDILYLGERGWKLLALLSVINEFSSLFVTFFIALGYASEHDITGIAIIAKWLETWAFSQIFMLILTSIEYPIISKLISGYWW